MINKDTNFFLAQEMYHNYSIFMEKSKLIELYSTYKEVNYAYSNYDIRKMINNFIKTNYLNETVIKSFFIKEVLFNYKSSICIYEFPVKSSRVDLCRINGIQGKSIGYEIKTDLDNLDRLNKQLRDYSCIFEELYVICSKNKLPSVLDFIDERIGVYVYSENKNKIKFTRFRKSQVNNDLDSFSQLNCIPKLALLNLFNLNKKDISNDKIIIKNYIQKNYSRTTINKIFKTYLIEKYKENWSFLKNNQEIILEIDYQWFFKTLINPQYLYN